LLCPRVPLRRATRRGPPPRRRRRVVFTPKRTMKGFAQRTTLCVALVGSASAFVGAPLTRTPPALGIRGVCILFTVDAAKAGESLFCCPGKTLASPCQARSHSLRGCLYCALENASAPVSVFLDLGF